MIETSHWDSLGLRLDPKHAVGFVYVIIDLETNQKYIGKKNYSGRGKLNKGQESNWKTYTSSSKYVNDQIALKGKEKFGFFIIEQYYTVGGLSFAETWSQVVYEIPCNNGEYFNRFIDKVTFKVTEPVTKRHKRILGKLIRSYPWLKP